MNNDDTRQGGNEKCVPQIEVTPEMIQAAERYFDFWDGLVPTEENWLEKVYRIMRSLEPGPTEQRCHGHPSDPQVSGIRLRANQHGVLVDLP